MKEALQNDWVAMPDIIDSILVGFACLGGLGFCLLILAVIMATAAEEPSAIVFVFFFLLASFVFGWLIIRFSGCAGPLRSMVGSGG